MSAASPSAGNPKSVTHVLCDTCAQEYRLAFSCKARYFCPSCHAKRLAVWTLWLQETLLAPVPHRLVLTIPKRLGRGVSISAHYRAAADRIPAA